MRAGLRGDLEALARHYTSSVRAFERAGDLRSACVQELNLVAALCELGLDADARARLDHGAREAEARGLLSAIALAHHLDGILRARAGDVDGAIAAQRRALETFASQGNARMEGGIRTHLAELLSRRGKLDDAFKDAERACELLASVPPARARALAVLALVQVARGNGVVALDASARALELAESGVEGGESIVYVAHIEALTAAGSPDVTKVRDAGRERLHARAAAISDPRAREAFLSAPENARLLA
jgi:tetratricopeptide (TPR) repeat protein